MIKNRQTSVLIPACSPQIIECDHPSGCICNHCKKHHVEQPESFGKLKTGPSAQDKSGSASVPTNLVATSSKVVDKEEGWEERFDNRFLRQEKKPIGKGVMTIWYWKEPRPHHNDIKEFISQVREDAYKEGLNKKREEFESVVEKSKTCGFLIGKYVAEAKREVAEDIWKLVDDIEAKNTNSSLDEWKEYKHIRNAIVDKYLSKEGGE